MRGVRGVTGVSVEGLGVLRLRLGCYCRCSGCFRVEGLRASGFQGLRVLGVLGVEGLGVLGVLGFRGVTVGVRGVSVEGLGVSGLRVYGC